MDPMLARDTALSPADRPTAADVVVQALDRHDQRRRAGVPAVSVLAGPVGLGIRAWQRWAARRRRPNVMVEGADPATVVTAWVGGLARARDLGRDAVAFLAARVRRPVDELAAAVGRMTRHELGILLDHHLHEASLGGAEAASRWLVEEAHAGRPVVPERLAGQVDAVLARRSEPWLGVPAALAEVVGPDDAPALLLVRPEPADEAVPAVAAAAGCLTEIASAVPGLPVGLALPADEWDAYLRLAPEAHAKATLRETAVPVAGLDETAICRRLEQADVPGRDKLAGAVRRLARDGASEELTALFVAAAGRPGGDPARSAAERFLYERLESVPDTAGLFEPNGGLGFPFGPREAEVDLACRALRLAVEVDGYYHFRDADAYRRDRRKDLALQRQGYLVLRFLADDVVARLDEILDTILAAVAFRKEEVTHGQS